MHKIANKDSDTLYNYCHNTRTQRLVQYDQITSYQYSVRPMNEPAASQYWHHWQWRQSVAVVVAGT